MEAQKRRQWHSLRAPNVGNLDYKWHSLSGAPDMGNLDYKWRSLSSAPNTGNLDYKRHSLGLVHAWETKHGFSLWRVQARTP